MQSTTDQPADDVFDRLRRSEELFARAFIQNPVAMAITDGESQCFTAANQRFLELIGHWRAEVIGRTSADLGLWTDEDDRQRVAAELNASGATPFVYGSVRAKNGKLIPCMAAFSLMEVDGKAYILSSLIPLPDPAKA